MGQFHPHNNEPVRGRSRKQFNTYHCSKSWHVQLISTGMYNSNRYQNYVQVCNSTDIISLETHPTWNEHRSIFLTNLDRLTVIHSKQGYVLALS